jgi:hypothetical protein
MMMTGKLSVIVEAFTPRHSNTLRGFCSVLIPEMRLRIHDVAIHEKNDSRWAALPAKPQITRDGTVKRDERGKAAYATIIEFADRDTREAFSQRVIASLLEFAPSAFSVEEDA